MQLGGLRRRRRWEPAFRSGIALFRYWIDDVRGLAGSLYGRREAREHEFATVWQPVGPNTTPIGGDLEGFARRRDLRLLWLRCREVRAWR